MTNLNDAFHRPAALAVAVAVLVGLTGCKSDGSGNTLAVETPRAASITITPGDVSLSFIGATVSLSATVRDQNGALFAGAVTWSSDNPSSFSVSSSGGLVTAIANGTGMVRATSGNASATATITVQQIASALAIISGDAQTAIAGQLLAAPIVVRARDQGGAAVEGVTVTFTPGSGGSATPPTATSDANGDAATNWTLGSTTGAQQLEASVPDGGTATVSAVARSEIPIPDLEVVGTILLSRPDPSSLETVDVRATIRNDGEADAEGGFRIQLLADGLEVGTADVAGLAVGALETVTMTVGPFAAGQRQLRLNVDADNAVEELDESNNTVVRNVAVVLQTPITAGTPITQISGAFDVELLFRLDLPPGSPNVLTAELTGGTGDVDLYIERGERPSSRNQYDDCFSGSPTTAELCQIVGAQAGPYHILLHAFSPFSGTTMNIELGGEVLPFNIELVFINQGTESQNNAFQQAAERWEAIIPFDIPDSDFSTSPQAANSCIEGQPLINDNVDDIRIFVSIVAIDGPLGTLAQAGPCVTRGLSDLPIVGSMEFDSADLEQLEANGDMIPVVLHEMGHALGIGAIWGLRGLLQNPSLPSNPGADTHFNGPLAIEAFDEAGGTTYTGGAKVPVENFAGEGSGDGHWRESVLGEELLTPFYQGGVANPLSAISIQSLADLGYAVDVEQAEAYNKVFSAPPRAIAPRRVTDLRGDLRQGLIVVVDAKGRVIGVRR